MPSSVPSRSRAPRTPRKSLPGPRPDHSERSRLHSTVSEAQVFAFDCRASATNTVGVFSTARRNRNQEVSEIRRACAGGVSPNPSRPPRNPALNQEIRRFQSVLGIFAGTNPNYAFQADPGRRGRSRVERIVRIDQSANLPARRRRRQNGMQQGSSPRRRGSDDLRQASPRQLDFRDAAGEKLRLRTRLPKHRFELFFERRDRHRIRLFFACTIFLQAPGGRCQAVIFNRGKQRRYRMCR